MQFFTFFIIVHYFSIFENVYSTGCYNFKLNLKLNVNYRLN